MKEVFSNAKKSMKSEQIIKIQDFSENYTCLVHSLHWMQTQATLYPVVVFRRDKLNNVIEEHLVFISPDLNHECTFVKYVNLLIHQYYQTREILINMT